MVREALLVTQPTWKGQPQGFAQLQELGETFGVSSEQGWAFTHFAPLKIFTGQNLPKADNPKDGNIRQKLPPFPSLFPPWSFKREETRTFRGLGRAPLVLPSSCAWFVEPYRVSQTQIPPQFPMFYLKISPGSFPQSKQLLPLLWPSTAPIPSVLALPTLLLHRDKHRPWKIPKFACRIPACSEQGKGLGLPPD